MSPVIKDTLPNSGMRLAMILQAIDACDREFSQEKDDYKARRKVLENQLHSLKLDIITGQKSLLDAIDEMQEAVGEGNTMTISSGGQSATLKGKPKGDAHV